MLPKNIGSFMRASNVVLFFILLLVAQNEGQTRKHRNNVHRLILKTEVEIFRGVTSFELDPDRLASAQKL